MKNQSTQIPLCSQGSLIALIAPAGQVENRLIEQAQSFLEGQGYKVAIGIHAHETYRGMAGREAERLADLQWALDQPEVKAIWALRGGYGLSQIMDGLDWNRFIKHPKWLIGFSDVTALQLQAAKEGFPSVHGSMPIRWNKEDPLNREQVLRWLQGGRIRWSWKAELQEGLELDNIQAPLLGGNLALICDSLGTTSEIQTEGCLLVLEDIDEAPHRVDRMLNQLQRAGKFKGIKGLIAGTCTDCQDEQGLYPPKYWEVLLAEYAKENGLPCFLHAPIGHGYSNRPFVQNWPAELKKDPEGPDWYLSQLLFHS